MWKAVLSIIGIFFFLPSGKAVTGDSLHYLTLQDTIFLSLGNYDEKIFEHQIAEKQTLFSLARFYGLRVEDVYYYNPTLREKPLEVDMKVRIPIPNRAIKRYKTWSVWDNSHIPVCYVVKRGDTLFGIAKRVFKMPIDSVIIRNNLFSTSLTPGQLLHIGWMSVYGIPDSLRAIQGGPLMQANYNLKRSYIQQSYTKREVINKGVAYWHKGASNGTGDFYALHRKARKNSIISVTNPMSGRTVYAKVLGKLPDSAYPPNIVVVLSPTTARLLGAKDPRFFVEVKYLR